MKAFIVNRDRVTPLDRMVQWLQSHAVDVHIIDNASTYKPLLDWYERSRLQVTRLDRNFGSQVAWHLGLIRRWTDGEFILTDSNLGLEGIPADWLDVLRQGLVVTRYPKCGFSLEISDLPVHDPFNQGTRETEQWFWFNKLPGTRYYDAAIDTTFALYRASCRDRWPGLKALRTDRPYTARHLSWYVDPAHMEEEERYFIEHASAENSYAVRMRCHLQKDQPGRRRATGFVADQTKKVVPPNLIADFTPSAIEIHSAADVGRTEPMEEPQGLKPQPRHSIRRVAIVFDDQVRPDTTGIYCFRALQALVEVEHFRPSQMAQMPRTGFDLYLSIDDGLDYPLRDDIGPWALWAIDTHLSLDRIIRRAGQAKWIFGAQKSGVRLFQKKGMNCLGWLPLAADPHIHRPHAVSKTFDLSFVGQLNTPERKDFTRLLQQDFQNSFVGQCFFEKMALQCSQSRIVTNRSVRDDLNMRVFESLACGSLLLTNDLPESGQNELFQAGVHLATYNTWPEFVEKAQYYLAHEDERERIAENGRMLVVARHTYEHRMESLLTALQEDSVNRVTTLAPSMPNVFSNSAAQRMSPEPSYVESPMTKDGADQPLTSIVILTFNQLPYTQKCLQSIRCHTQCPYELIVVDNGSTDGTVDYLRQQADVQLIVNAHNRGFAAGVNQGIKVSKGSSILLLNNDVLVTDGWLKRMLTSLQCDPGIGLVGPSSNNVSGPQQITSDYSDIKSLSAFAEGLAAKHAGELEFVTRLVGFCMLFRRELVDQIGLLDERFGIGTFEDDDFCRRAGAAGYRAAIVRSAFVHHAGSVSFRANGIDLGGLLEHNRDLFLEKWGTKPRATRPIEDAAAAENSLPTLSLCMIVRDSSRTLGACLASIKPWIDEMVVVDTGSLDDTRDIARSFGARVMEFPWCDSFAAARNESLRHATGDWLFWMDADDTIDAANGRKLKELFARPIPPSAMGFVVQVHCLTNEGADHKTSTVVDHIKIIRRHPAIRFTGRVHEQVLGVIRELGGEVIRTDLFVTHSGADRSPAGRRRKHARDLKLLKLELADNPDNTFTLFHLGMTLGDMGKYHRALSYLCRSLQNAVQGDSHLRKIYALLVQAYGKLGRPATALKTCLQGLAVCPDDPELLFHRGVLEQGAGKLQEAENSFLSVLKKREGRHFVSIDSGIFGSKAWHNLALIYEAKGDIAAALVAWCQVLTQDPANRPAWWSVILLCSGKDFVGVLKKLNATIPQARHLQDVRAAAQAQIDAYEGRLAVALQNIEALENQEPLSVELLESVSQLAFGSERLDLAQRWLTDLTGRVPRNAAAHQNLAIVYFRQSNFLQAIGAVRQALVLRPDYPESVALLKECHRLIGETSRAVPSKAPAPEGNSAESLGYTKNRFGDSELPASKQLMIHVTSDINRLPVFGFMHIAMHGRWKSIVSEQLEKLDASGLYERSQRIFVGLLGSSREGFQFHHPKLEIIHYSDDFNEYEFPTLGFLHQFCQSHEGLVYYIHTKGVFRDTPNTRDWRHFMEYFTITRFQDCLDALRSHDLCGVDWTTHPWPHFSGNFWWARADYVRTLQLPQAPMAPSMIDPLVRLDCERWIGSGAGHAACLHLSGVNHYLQPTPPETYVTATELHHPIQASGESQPVGRVQHTPTPAWLGANQPNSSRIDAPADDKQVGISQSVGHWPIVGFMHVAMKGHWRQIVNEQLLKLRVSGLWEKTDRLFVGLLGSKADAEAFDISDKKITVAFRDPHFEGGEIPTLGVLYDYCLERDCLVYYMHTKGTFRTGMGQEEWRRAMEHFLIFRHEECIEALEKHDTCGINYMHAGWCQFYAGNFWWARSDYVRTLPDVRTLKPLPKLDPAPRYVAERWIGENRHMRAANLHSTKTDHYANQPYPRSRYARLREVNVSEVPSDPSVWRGLENRFQDLLEPIGEIQLIVDLGVNGLSTCCFARAAPSAKVINIHAEDVIHRPGFPNIAVLKANSLRASQDLPGQIDVLNMDGALNYDSILREFRTWEPRIRAGGCALFHGIMMSLDGIGRAFGELSGRKAEIQECGGLGVWYKPK